MDSSTALSVILLVAGALFTILFGWLGARPLDITKGPRMIPWQFLMLLAATFTIVMLAILAHHYGLMPASQLRY